MIVRLVSLADRREQLRGQVVKRKRHAVLVRHMASWPGEPQEQWFGLDNGLSRTPDAAFFLHPEDCAALIRGELFSC